MLSNGILCKQNFENFNTANDCSTFTERNIRLLIFYNKNFNCVRRREYRLQSKKKTTIVNYLETVNRINYASSNGS